MDTTNSPRIPFSQVRCVGTSIVGIVTALLVTVLFIGCARRSPEEEMAAAYVEGFEGFTTWRYGHVVELTFPNCAEDMRTKIDPQKLCDAVSVMPNLEHVEFWDMCVPDCAMRELSSKQRLHTLFLHFTNVDNADIGRFKDHPKLREISLMGTDVDEAVVPTLASMPRLEFVDLIATRIPPQELRKLASLERLDWLGVSVIEPTDQDIAALNSLENVKHLHVISPPGIGPTPEQARSLDAAYRGREVFVNDTGYPFAVARWKNQVGESHWREGSDERNRQAGK
jgi:hypothetical protein